MVEEENIVEYNFTLYNIIVPSTGYICSNQPLRSKKITE